MAAGHAGVERIVAVVWGDRIFVNSPSKEEAPAEAAPAPKGKRGGPGGGGRGPEYERARRQELLLLCLDRATGKEVWRKQVDRGNQIRMKHNSSSPSPVTDGRHVWVVSGNGMLRCYDFAGNETWSFDVPDTLENSATTMAMGRRRCLWTAR
jgi:outer membrane protein assembly factor BamB